MQPELCAQLHNRMPVVLKSEHWPVWLGEEPAEASALKALLRPIPSDVRRGGLVDEGSPRWRSA